MSSQILPYSKTYEIYDFLEKEFLNADNETLRLIINYYYAHFGKGAGDYLISTYNSWKNGYTKISSLTFGRIIECMPKYLSEEKRFVILKSEVNKFLEVQKEVYEKRMFISLYDIHPIFSEIQSKILNFSREDLQWFIGKNIFTEELIQHYLKICRFVLNEKIIQAYQNVINDLALIKHKLSNFNNNVERAYYKMNFIRQEAFAGKESRGILVRDIKDYEVKFTPLKKFVFEIDNSIKKFGEIYFLEELMKLSFDEKNNVIKATQKNNDIDIFFAQFLDSKNQTNNSISMKGSFEGEGGTLEMSLEFIPYKILIKSIFGSIIKVVLLICLPALLIIATVKYANAWVVFFYIYGFIVIISQISKEFDNLKTAKRKIKSYGKR